MFSKIKNGAAVVAISATTMVSAPTILAANAEAKPVDGVGDVLSAKCYYEANAKHVSADICDHKKGLSESERKCIIQIDATALTLIGTFLDGGATAPALFAAGGTTVSALNTCF